MTARKKPATTPIAWSYDNPDKTEALADMEATMATTELPMSAPLVTDSGLMRVKLSRDVANAEVEMAFISEQMMSAERIRSMVSAEADTICQAEIAAAQNRMEGARLDAASICDATVSGLQRRRDDVARMIDGLKLALDATKGGA